MHSSQHGDQSTMSKIIACIPALGAQQRTRRFAQLRNADKHVDAVLILYELFTITETMVT
jgi:hypothetical protein